MQRVAILSLSLVLTVLFGWLLQFALADIGDIEGPDRGALREEMVSAQLRDRETEILQESRTTERDMESQREDQALLDESLTHSEATMQQLMALHRLSLEKGVDPTARQQDALAESQALFLENQARSQAATEQVSELVRRRRELALRKEAVEAELEAADKPVWEEYTRQKRKHDFLLASLKLGLLIPLLAFVSRRAQRNRGKRFLALWISALVAAFFHVTLVMHEYFPSDVFKYIAITAGILIILVFLISVLRQQVVHKPAEVNRRPIADSYRAARCPRCSFPFQLRLSENARARPSSREYSAADREPYTCPSCGTGLFGPCESCGSNRHTLLPFCVSCGAGSDAEKAVAAPAT